jgi:putative transposase
MPLRRNRTSPEYIFYALHLYFSGLSLRKASKHLSQFVRRNHVSIWNWIQHYKPEKAFHRKTKICEFIVDETLIKVSGEFVWLWIASEPKDKTILGIHISYERSMLIAEHFIHSLVKKYGKHPVSTDGGTWYPQACRFLKLQHHIHSPYEKSIIERAVQYVKDRTESFDDYFPCRMEREEGRRCKLQHITNWFNLFTHMHNRIVAS